MSSAIAPMFLTFKSSGLATDQVRHLHVVYVLRPYVLRSACYVLRAEIRRPSTFYVLRSFFNVTSSKFLQRSTFFDVFWRSTCAVLAFDVRLHGGSLWSVGWVLDSCYGHYEVHDVGSGSHLKEGENVGQVPYTIG